MRLCIYLFAILIISGCEKANNDAVKKNSPKDVASLLSKNQTSFRTYLAEWRNGEKKIYSMNLSVQISTDELENPYKFHDWIPVQMRDQLGDSLILALDKNSTEGKKLWELIKSGNRVTTKIHFYCNSYNKKIVELDKISSAYK